LLRRRRLIAGALLQVGACRSNRRLPLGLSLYSFLMLFLVISAGFSGADFARVLCGVGDFYVEANLQSMVWHVAGVL
jgi:hypothetical protein